LPKVSIKAGPDSGKVYEVAQAVKIPIMGIGGIMTTEDAVEFLLAGATAVQVGTANFIDPSASMKIAEGLGRYCDESGVKKVTELVGALKVKAGASARSPGNRSLSSSRRTSRTSLNSRGWSRARGPTASRSSIR